MIKEARVKRMDRNRGGFKGFFRWLRYKYLLLLNAKGGPGKVAKGFSIGLAIEMFTLPTLGLAAVLILPLVYLLRASLPGAVLGFVFGKLIYIPMAFLNRKVGSFVLPNGIQSHIHIKPGWMAVWLANWLENLVRGALDLIVGGMIVGAALGVVAYFPVKLLLELYANRRKDKRKRRKAQIVPRNTR